MSSYKLIINGLVLTLGEENKTGYYNIAVKDEKITKIAHPQDMNEKVFLSNHPDGEVIDASDKIIMPGLLNASVNSAYYLNKIFLKKCSFENINENVSLRLINKFLSNPENLETLNELFTIRYYNSVKNGEVFVNEISPVITKYYYDSYIKNKSLKQYYRFVSFDSMLSSSLRENNDGLIFGYKPDPDVNNYTLTSFKKSLSSENVKLFLEVSQSHNLVNSLINIFGKPFIEVLDDFDLLSENTMLFNPVFVTHREVSRLKAKNVNLIFSPSDIIKFTNKDFNPVEFFSAGINVMLGTGLLGKDILSELKIMASHLYRYHFPYERLIRLATTNTAKTFGLYNETGSISKNKYADMIFFTLNDLRNFMTLPELDSEKLSEFIIEELSVKDISDVIIKGDFILKDGKEISKNDYLSVAAGISDELYEVGKYFEFKEKYLRRKRVKEVSLEKDAESYNSEYEENYGDKDDSDFRVIGKKFDEDSFDQNKDFSDKPESVHSLSEIASLDEGFNLFEEDKESMISKEKKRRILEEQHYSLFEEKYEQKGEERIFEIKNTKKEKTLSPTEKKPEPPPKESDDVKFKKEKLKFGFSDDEF